MLAECFPARVREVQTSVSGEINRRRHRHSERTLLALVIEGGSMTFSDWAMQQIARCTSCEGREDMKLVWILVRGKKPVRFWTGQAWSTDENRARTFPTAGEARETAYNMQAEYQDTIVAEGVYRRKAEGTK